MKIARFGPLGLLVLGAAAIVLGTLLVWLQPPVDAFSSGEVSFPMPDIRGTDVVLGTVALGGALVAFTAALLGRRLGTVVPSVIGAVTGILGGAAGVRVLLDPRGVYLDGAVSRLGSDELSGDVIRSSLEFPLTQGLIEVGVKPGVWIVLAGAAVILIGALWLLLAPGRRSSTAVRDERALGSSDEVAASAPSAKSTSGQAPAETIITHDAAEAALPDEQEERAPEDSPGTRSAHPVSELGDSWAG